MKRFDFKKIFLSFSFLVFSFFLFLISFNFTFAKVGARCSDSVPCDSGETCDSSTKKCVASVSSLPKMCLESQFTVSKSTDGVVCLSKINSGEDCFQGAADGTDASCKSGYCNSSTKKCEDDPNCSAKGRYKLTTGIPMLGASKGQCMSVDDGMDIFLGGILKFILGSVGTITVIIIIVAGFMWSFSAGNKNTISRAQKMMTDAVIGLVMTLTSGLILQVVNPRLIQVNSLFAGLKVNSINIPPPKGDALPTPTGTEGAPYTAASSKTVAYLKALGINCNPEGNSKSSSIYAVASSFNGKMVYRLGSKNAVGTDAEDNLPCPSRGACYDCSGYVKQVLYCAGFKESEIPSKILTGNSTKEFFDNAGAEYINLQTGCNDNDTVNNKKLNPGDLLGWFPFKSGNTGHVLMYVGGGTYMDSHWNTDRNGKNALGVYNPERYSDYGKGICGYFNMLKSKFKTYDNPDIQLRLVRIAK